MESLLEETLQSPPPSPCAHGKKRMKVCVSVSVLEIIGLANQATKKHKTTSNCDFSF
jgi:hypothetical protein